MHHLILLHGIAVVWQDAHVVKPALLPMLDLVAVLDGHGGPEVARWLADRLAPLIGQHPTVVSVVAAAAERSLKTADLDALSDAVCEIIQDVDLKVATEEAKAEMRKMLGDDDDDDDDSITKNSDTGDAKTAAGSSGNKIDEELRLLQEEATIPVEKLLDAYKADIANGEAEGGELRSTSLLAQLLAAADEIESDESSTSDSSSSSDDHFDHNSAGGTAEGNAAVCPAAPDDAARARGRKRSAADNEPDIAVADSAGQTAKRQRQRRHRVAEPAVEEAPGVTSGTTLNLVLLLCDSTAERYAICVNVGDSRSVLARGTASGRRAAVSAIDLSADHKPEDPLETARVKAAGGKVDRDGRINGGLNLSRAIGDHQYKVNVDLPPNAQLVSSEPDVVVKRLRPADSFIVVACDGIWNSMESDEVIPFVSARLGRSGFGLTDAAAELCDECMADVLDGDGAGLDNETAVIIDLRSPPPWAVTTKL